MFFISRKRKNSCWRRIFRNSPWRYRNRSHNLKRKYFLLSVNDQIERVNTSFNGISAMFYDNINNKKRWSNQFNFKIFKKMRKTLRLIRIYNYIRCFWVAPLTWAICKHLFIKFMYLCPWQWLVLIASSATSFDVE